jgi:putative oxidoreductase
MNPSSMLGVLRIVTGLLFLEHGTQKVMDFPPAPAMPAVATHTAAAAAPGLMSLLGHASGPIELIGGLLITVGLFTRPAAFILAGEMAIAYFMVHFSKDFFPIINKGELAVIYCFVFLYFTFAGGGAWALDGLLRRNRAS